MSYILLGIVSNKVRLVALAIILAVLFSMATPVLAAAQSDITNTNHDAWVSSAETQDALQTVPGVLDDSAPTSSDADSAATTATVDVPRDAEQGVTFGTQSGLELDIQLPSAAQAAGAQQVAPGVVGYEGGNGSATAVQPTADGGVRMLTIIDNPNAPSEYEYKVTVPGGGHIELLPTGGAVVLSSNGEALSTVSAPWAKDAAGNVVETYFSTNGHSLVQHVNHRVPGVVYPVAADPFWQTAWRKARGAWNTFNGRKITQCFAGGLLVGTGVLTSLVAAPISMGSSTILGIAVIGGSAEYVKCRLG
jgi:hypothetical protein